MFVTDALGIVGPGHGHVYKITPGGVRSTLASGFIAPEGLAFDSAGNLFVTDLVSGNILKFTPNGTRSTFASGVGGVGLAFDSAGNLFVDNSTIYKFTPDGVRTTFASGFGGFLAFGPP